MSSEENENEVKEVQKRSEFIEKFSEKNKKENNSKERKEKGRWNMLYNQSKMRKAKEEKYREEMLKNRNKTEQIECTFSPQKFNNYKMKNEKEDENGENEEDKNLDKNLHSFMKRQAKWLQKRALQIEGIKEKKNNKDVEECLFRPIMVK